MNVKGRVHVSVSNVFRRAARCVAAAFCAVALVLTSAPAFAQEDGGSWRTLDYMSTHIQIRRPPVCQQGFPTQAALLSCLRGQKWDLGYYVNEVGPSGGRKHIYGVIYEQVRTSTIVESGYTCGQLNASHPDFSTSGVTCYRLRSSGPSHTNFVTLVDGSGNELNNATGDNRLYFRNRVPAGIPVCNPALSTCESGSMQPGTSGVPSIGYFPSVPPDDDGGDGSCVDRWIYVTWDRPSWDALPIKPGVGTQHSQGECVYEYRIPDRFTGLMSSPCGPFLSGHNFCHLVGIQGLDEAAEPTLTEISEDSPLEFTVGHTQSESAAMKVPDTWNELFGWGSTIAPRVDATAQHLPVLGAMYQGLQGLTPEEWQLVEEAHAGGYLDFALAPLDNNCTIQEYYHPGNYTAGGKCLGAYDRDWGQTPYEPEKAWNWSPIPATETPPEQLEVINQPVPPGTPSTPSVTNVTRPDGSFQLNGVDVKVPPGVSHPTNPGGPTEPPPDSSAPEPEYGGGDGDGNRFYTPKYPDGVSGVWGDYKQQIMDESGMGPFLDAFRMPTNVATADLCFSFDFDMGEVVDLGEQGFCIDENIILIVKALMIISAFLVARRLVFGG